MSTPHVCPKCNGEKQIFGGLFGEQVYRECPTCNGTGVIWEPEIVGDSKWRIDYNETGVDS
jgi:DnaJ-class molecular chaperone